MAYLIEGLDPTPFAQFFTMSDAQLRKKNIAVVQATDSNYPCRISLCEATMGDRLLLLNHEHQPAETPYRSAHAIYVAQGSTSKGVYRDAIPPILRPRMLSIRAFDGLDMMIDADLVEGNNAEVLVAKLLSDPRAAYLHIHFAKRGCFAAKVMRN